ncbi:toll/interleukin-1 receptor domain-containing protein [Gynuella sp.]|uniref:toll/interleukin-1 receptor domain-containing protein n=1 Tax=Gynuella sp. TaxID=2969146 RepID=UPI003D0BA699
MKKLKLFYSYSHKDESYREKLETHLSILRRNKYISEWHDRRISAGSDWEEEINYNLEDSDIILLLVSSNFLASDYCYDTETIRALEKHESGDAVVIPIILSPCLWLESELKVLHSLPNDNKAISVFENEDVAWLEVAEGILAKVKELQTKSTSKPLTRESTPGKTINLCDLVADFLKEFDTWYFSPLRIQKWGSRQHGFEELARHSTKDIKACLEEYKKQGRVKTTISRKGNTIYKVKG